MTHTWQVSLRKLLRLRFSLLFCFAGCLFPAIAYGNSDCYRHIYFENSLNCDFYFCSSGRASSPSLLEQKNGRLTVETKVFLTPPNALRLDLEKPSRRWALLALWIRVGKPERWLKFNPQCQLPDTISAGVTDASGENLSECTLAVNTLSQILARIIEVWMVQDVGKARLELECDPLCHPESLAKAEVPSSGPRANERPYTGVAKAASSR
jgi:hypothetical protein